MTQKILVVDDSISLRKMVGGTLKDAGYDVIEAAGGAEALAALQAGGVHLMLTDLTMPELDGIELIKQARAIPAAKFIPMLMLTVESQSERIQAGRAVGATGWIVKPFKPEQLLAVIKKVLG